MNIKKTMILMGLTTAVAASALVAAAYSPSAVELTNVRPNYPWSTDVDLDFEVKEDAGDNHEYFLRISLEAGGKTYVLHAFDEYELDEDDNTCLCADNVLGTWTCPSLINIPQDKKSFTVTWKPDREPGIPRELFKDAKFKVERVIHSDTPYPWTPYSGYIWVGPASGDLTYRGNHNPGELNYSSEQGIMMARIPAGTFRMGHMVGQGEFERFKDVTLTNDFYMSTTPVTKALIYELEDETWQNDHKSWRLSQEAVTGFSYGQLRGNGSPADPPAANSIIGRLREKTGLDLDLPTLAQYRYACTGGRRRLSMSYPDKLLDFETNAVGHLVVEPYAKLFDTTNAIKGMVQGYIEYNNVYEYDNYVYNSDGELEYRGELYDSSTWSNSGDYVLADKLKENSLWKLARLHTWGLEQMLGSGSFYVRDRASGPGFSDADFAALGTVEPLLAATGDNSHPLWAGSPSYGECGSHDIKANYFFNDCYYEGANQANIGFRLVCSSPTKSKQTGTYLGISAPITLDLRETAPIWSWNKGENVRVNHLSRWGRALKLRYDQKDEWSPWFGSPAGDTTMWAYQVSFYPESLDDYNTWGWEGKDYEIDLTTDNWVDKFPGPGLYEVWDESDNFWFELYLWSPLSVKIDKARQRYPWNGKIDVDYTSENGDGSSDLELVLTAGGQEYRSTSAHLSGETSCGGAPGCKKSEDSDPMIAGPQQHRITWDAAADGATNAVDKSATLILRAKKK